MVARLTQRVAFSSLLIVMAVGILAPQPALAQNFVTLNYPSAADTRVTGINNHGEMAGFYYVNTPGARSARNGISHKPEVRGPAVFSSNNTAPAIEGVTHGFIFQNGTFTNIDFPGETDTEIWAINDNGDVVGYYYDGTRNHGFLLSNGVYTTIDPPGSVDTFVQGINNIGQVVGNYDDADGNQIPFLLSAGVYTDLSFPTSVYYPYALGINNLGAVVGNYDDSIGNGHGFLLLQNGTFTSIDYPDDSPVFLTQAWGINDGNQIVGTYLATSESELVGYEDNNGIFTVIAVPGATGEDVFDINNGGQLVGDYGTGTNVQGYVTATGPSAYVANINSNTVSVIDIPTSLLVNTLQVGSGPWGVAVSPDETQVYVSNNHGNSVSVINTASSTVSATIQVESSPFGVAFTPDGTQAYVVNGSSNSVSVISTASQTVVATVPVQQSPVGVAMALTSNGTFAYVTNSASNSVSVIAVGSTPTVVQTIAVGSGPRWVAVAPNSSLAYVENAGSNSVSVISVATNTVTATVPVGTSPFGAAFTPDSSLAYVVNSASNTVSVIDTASSGVVATVAGFNNPVHVALSADGSSAYVTNLNANNVSVIATASNTITGAIAVGSAPIDVAIASAPPTSQQITQPLSPTQPNVFNFGTNSFVVQYPPGTGFSNVKMTVTAVEMTPAEFQQRVAGTQFASAACIVYAGTGGNCEDDQVTCSENSSPITCPSEAQPSIAVQTSFGTSQAIVNPGYLTTPIGENDWTNIFAGYSDPRVKGKTSGFSEFVAVSLGATNPQGLAQFKILYPVFPKNYSHGLTIPIAIRLTSVATGKPVTDATASISVEMIADGKGNPTQQVVFSKTDAFKFRVAFIGMPNYEFDLHAAGYAAGTYNVTIYGNAFATYQGQFKILK